MKTRSGFVSNSSSASFIVLFSGYKDKAEWEGGSLDLYGDDLEEARKGTTLVKAEKLEDGDTRFTFQAEAHTFMYNNFGDFPNWIKQIYLILAIDPDRAYGGWELEKAMVVDE